jgi:hypothetical protein
VIPAVRDPAPPTAAVPAAPPGRGDLALRVAGGTVALLAGAVSALVEGFLIPARIGGWPLPLAPLLAAVLGIPLVRYAARVTDSRLGTFLPAAGWLGAITVLVLPTAEGDLILPETPMGLAFFCAGTIAFVVALYRPPTMRAGRITR